MKFMAEAKVFLGPNLDLLCVQQLGTAPFCENYAKFYFDAKHLEKGLNRGWWNFFVLFFQKVPFLVNNPILAPLTF